MAAYKETTDAANGTSTKYSLVAGDTFTGSLTSGDADWIKITLTAGKAYQFDMSSSSSNWAILDIRDLDGMQLDIDENNRDGDFDNASIKFVADRTGTYYIRVGSHDDEWNSGYTLKTKVITAPKFASYDTIAKQLTTDYWTADGGTPYKFNVKAGGTLTVNITALTAQGQQLAKWALDAWTAASGLNFKYVTGASQIRFDDNQSGAFGGSDSIIGGYTTASSVNVDVSWIKDYGAGQDSYTLSTYIHEIGHALGLGHAGNYDGNATFGVNNTFQNDSEQLTVMSYFDASDSVWVKGNYAVSITPMMVDVLAIRALYGTTAINSGNTTYNLQAKYAGDAVALTIVDTGGVDVLDFSWAKVAQTINLNAEKFSSVAGGINNLSLARGTVIEKAVGGSGFDIIIGNASANTLYGKAGNDKLDGGAGNDALVGGAGADKLIGGTGIDTAYYTGGTKGVIASLQTPSTNTNDAKGDTYSSIENLSGTSYADRLVGNDGANKISGGAGNDIIYGGLGNDVLVGGTGADTFVFHTKPGSTNIDTIDDFSVTDDRIVLDDDIFTKAGKVGDLTSAAFYTGTTAHDSTDRVIYDKTTGKLFYDADGTGAVKAIQFALLDTALKMTSADFDIIA